jgi:hypothetical protein
MLVEHPERERLASDRDQELARGGPFEHHADDDAVAIERRQVPDDDRWDVADLEGLVRVVDADRVRVEGVVRLMSKNEGAPRGEVGVPKSVGIVRLSRDPRDEDVSVQELVTGVDQHEAAPLLVRVGPRVEFHQPESSPSRHWPVRVTGARDRRAPRRRRDDRGRRRR